MVFEWRQFESTKPYTTCGQLKRLQTKCLQMQAARIAVNNKNTSLGTVVGSFFKDLIWSFAVYLPARTYLHLLDIPGFGGVTSSYRKFQYHSTLFVEQVHNCQKLQK